MTRLLLRDPGAAADLATFGRRTVAYDRQGVVRLVARGGVIACFAHTPFDVLAMRSVALAVAAALDVVVEASGLVAGATAATSGGALDLPEQVAPLRWTGALPPRQGWREEARLSSAEVAARVRSGVEEFRQRVDALAVAERTRPAMEAIAEGVWSRPLHGSARLNLAHAAQAYGFLAGESEVVLRSVPGWQRLDGPYGTVLQHRFDALGLLFG